MASYSLRTVQNSSGSPGTRLTFSRWWICQDYGQTDYYLDPNYEGLPRWKERHWTFGHFNTEASPEYTHGADGPIDIGNYGPCPFKLQGVSGSVFNYEVRLEIDCKLVNGSSQTVAVTVPDGFTDTDFVELHKACVPSNADAEASPWTGQGLYIDVTDIRYAGDYTPPDGLEGRLTVVNDVPGLRYANGAGLTTTNRQCVWWDMCFLVPVVVGGVGGSDMCHDLFGGRYGIFWNPAGLLRFMRGSGTTWGTPVEVGTYTIPYNGGAEIKARGDGLVRITLGHDDPKVLRSLDDGATWVEEA